MGTNEDCFIAIDGREIDRSVTRDAASPEHALAELRPDFPGAVEFFGGGHPPEGFHDLEAPHVRQRGRILIARRGLELDRIEAKIQALVESSVNRQDPDALSSQIEGVAASVQSTEAAIRELQQITGVVDQIQEPPAILDADWRKVAQ